MDQSRGGTESQEPECPHFDKWLGRLETLGK